VVALRSASDNLSSLQGKMREYMENGAKLGWLLDPQNRRVEIYRSQSPVEVLENPTELSGEEILQRIWKDE
jgi:Uma2 family endonuclease